MSWLRKDVSYELMACCQIPRWYGVSYQHYNRAEVVFHLIPFNLVARFLHEARFFLKQGGYSPHRRKLLTTEVVELRAQVEHQLRTIQILRLQISENSRAWNRRNHDPVEGSN
jgi:hypothetical protein